MPTWHQAGQRVQRRIVQSDPTYAAMVDNLDANVGRLIAALGRAGKLGDTLIVFTSDNGGLATAEGSPTCNAPLAEGKGWMEDGGVRVPFIVAWPGHVPVGVSDRIFTTPDIYPTLLSAAGLPAKPMQHVDGHDLWSAWSGQTVASERGPIYWHYPHYSNQGGRPGAAVRDGDYKLIRCFEDGRQALFDLVDDVGETTDLAAGKPEIVARLARLLDAWSDDVVALIPKPNDHARFTA